MRDRIFSLSLFLAILFLAGCKAYKQDILFRLDDNFSEEDLARPIDEAEKNYRLKVNDLLRVDVFTNKGERIVDPNFELTAGGGGQNNRNQQQQQFEYLIFTDSTVKLPIIGVVKLADFTVFEAESILEQAYNDYYKDSFVKMQINNRRVVVLGANGGQVIPIANDNISLIEVLALYGGLNLGAKAQSIKLIRGELRNPEVFLMDLSTLEGTRRTNMLVRSGDVIYVEPWRRPWLESIRDFTPILGLSSSIFTLIIVIQNLAN